MARRLDFVWPPVSQAQIKKEIEELSRKKLEHDSFSWVIEGIDHAAEIYFKYGKRREA